MTTIMSPGQRYLYLGKDTSALPKQPYSLNHHKLNDKPVPQPMFGEKQKGMMDLLKSWFQDDYVSPREQARQLLESAKTQAAELINQAKAKADEIVHQANTEASTTKKEADAYAKEVRDLADEYAQNAIKKAGQNQKESPLLDQSDAYSPIDLFDD